MVTAAAGTARGAGRLPWIASVALAVAILAISVVAVRTLLVAPVAEPVPATTAPPAAAPSAAAPSVAPAPATPPAPAGAPSVTDTAGRALPAAVATGVGGLYTALGAGDLAGVESRYAPSAAFDASPWRQVAPLLADPAARERLLTALRSDPQRRSGIYRYAAGGALVGVDSQGRMAFLQLP